MAFKDRLKRIESRVSKGDTILKLDNGNDFTTDSMEIFFVWSWVVANVLKTGGHPYGEMPEPPPYKLLWAIGHSVPSEDDGPILKESRDFASQFIEEVTEEQYDSGEVEIDVSYED